jgi:5-methylcytosine-specific restriction endonuclease McrA
MKVEAKEAAEIIGIEGKSHIYRFLKRHHITGVSPPGHIQPKLYDLAEILEAKNRVAVPRSGLPAGLRTSNPQLYKRLWHQLRGTRSGVRSKRKRAHKTPAKQREWQRKYRAKDPLGHQIKQLRSDIKGRPNTFDKSDWAKRLEQTGGCCAYCGRQHGNGRRKEMQFEHVVPISVGGWNTYENVVPSCPSCNVKKSDRFISPFDMDADGTTHFGPIHYAGIVDSEPLEKMLKKSVDIADGVV